MDDDQFAETLRTNPNAAITYLDDDWCIQSQSITLAKAKKETKVLVTELFDSWLQLRSIIHQYGGAVHKRWSKKTAEQ